MAFSVTNTFTGQTTLSAASLDANFADVVNLLNGGLKTANLSASAAIVNTQLSTSNFYIPITMNIYSVRWVAASAGEVVAIAGVPIASGVFTVAGLSWMTTDVGARTGKFRVEWGGPTGASNAWVNVTTCYAAVTLTNAAGNNLPGTGSSTSTTTITQLSTPSRSIAVICDTADNTAVSTSTDVLSVTVWLKHALV